MRKILCRASGRSPATAVLAVVLVLAASLGLAAAAGAARVRPAAMPGGRALTGLRGATASCGLACADFSSAELGPGVILNAYVAGDTGVVPPRGGQDITLKYAANFRPNADFLLAPLGLVRSFCASATRPGGVLQAASAACQHYGGHEAYELDWAPYGRESGYCAGTAGPPYDGKNVRLLACGTTEGSLLIAQNPDAIAAGGGAFPPGTPSRGFSAYLTGANPTLRRRPFVLTVNAGTDDPDNQVQLVREDALAGGAHSVAEEFCDHPGPAGDAPAARNR